jgi:hypothetical protein
LTNGIILQVFKKLGKINTSWQCKLKLFIRRFFNCIGQVAKDIISHGVILVNEPKILKIKIEETWNFQVDIWSGGIYFSRLANQKCKWNKKWSRQEGQHPKLPQVWQVQLSKEKSIIVQ